MILISVIVGYILGIAPFIYLKLIDKKEKENETKQEEKKERENASIFDEWLNGPKTELTNQVNQEDIYNEYITGEVKKGE